VKLHTIGFTKKSAKTFFETLRRSGAKTLIDVRLNNVSQLAGFAKRADLEYFLREITDIGYVHMLELAPTQEMLDDYRKNDHDWHRYEQRFLTLLKERKVEDLPRETFDDGCLLCSEATAHRCHRRLVAEYLKDQWGDLEILHL
jgi:uncharacterized protein (DUF488 family)